jgi:hypothetical protein
MHVCPQEIAAVMLALPGLAWLGLWIKTRLARKRG